MALVPFFKYLLWNIKAMGIGRGEAMPVTQLEPPPTFPPIENQVLFSSCSYLMHIILCPMIN